MIQVKEVLRRWLSGGEGLRPLAEAAGVDRKTARRYIEAAEALGIARDGGLDQLSDEVIGAVCDAVRPTRPNGHGHSWELLGAHQATIKGWIDKGLSVAKVGDLLARRGVVVPERTLQRFCAERCGAGRTNTTTVRVADGEPGREAQTDFGRMGLIFDPVTGRRRVVHALIVVAAWSRHMFVWLTFGQRTEDVIAGLEAAWEFFGGVFPILIPDNLSPVVTKADPTEPRFNDTFLEYAQARGFLIDAARVRHPKDKPRVERQVPYVRGRFFAGEHFVDLADAQRRVEHWCRDEAGTRIHGTTRCEPKGAFLANEQSLLLPAPTGPYDVPVFSRPKVHRDHHVEVARAIYSVPGNLIGSTITARADRTTVKLFAKGHQIKVHPRQPPGGRSTDPADLPQERTAYALRDIDHLISVGTSYGPSIGAYTRAVLDHPLPWTKMRQAYRLLGLVKKWGPQRVEAACGRATRGRGGQCEPDRADDQAGHRGRPRRGPDPAADHPGTLRPRRRRVPVDAGGLSMSAPTPTVTPEFKAMLRRLGLGQMAETLPERVVTARHADMAHLDFLEMVLCDEIARRDLRSAGVRAKAAHLDPTMVLEDWNEESPVTYDHRLFSELATLRFIDEHHNVLIMGPVGVGKTFLATALGHIACRRRYRVHFERADRLFKRLKATRLDNSTEVEMRKLFSVDLLIIDDFAIQPLDVQETFDFYGIVVERYRHGATIVTSNRDPSEFLAAMADPLIAQSAVDRLQGAAYELIVEGQSYRKRQRPTVAEGPTESPAPRQRQRPTG